MKDDKAAVRADYTAGMSFRALEEKYGIPKSTIAGWAKLDGWVQEKRIRRPKRNEIVRAAIKTLGQLDSDIPDIRTEDMTEDDDYQLMRRYVNKLLHKADQILDIDDALAPRDLKSVSSMLLDVRTLMNVLSPREAKEQAARLRSLEKQAETEKQTADPVVIQFIDTEGTEI